MSKPVKLALSLSKGRKLRFGGKGQTSIRRWRLRSTTCNSGYSVNTSLISSWCAKEGERYITATRPSVVEVLLKEAEERSKQTERGAQGDKAEGSKQETE